jgi:hypothetical protein
VADDGDRLDGFRAFLESAQAETQRWQERELTPDELADLRAPFAVGSGEELMWAAIEVIFWKVAYDDPEMLALLTDGQRAVLALWWTYSEVGNGGLHQYFLNSTGFILPETVAGADLLGEADLARNLRRAAAHLGEPYPRDYDARNLALERLPDPDDAFWNDLDDSVYPTLETLAGSGIGDYITEHPEQFFRPG